ncbi:unnamed protein product [Ostreobium quekettii]|uniref:RAP domain-containing protein n=1 Tax=Ostreobium quekettii TaxID=121088 RepID=A0A8S1J0B7_9CHLO|nr:unnamed protein product [Ostreobium quekettii]
MVGRSGHDELAHGAQSRPEVVKNLMLLMENMAKLADAAMISSGPAAHFKDMCNQCLPALKAFLKSKKDDLRAEEVARLISIFGELNISEDVQMLILRQHSWSLAALIEKFADQVSELPCRDVANAMFAMGRYQLHVRKLLGPKEYADDLFAKILEKIEPMEDDMTPEDLSKVMNGIANMKYRDKGYLMRMVDYYLSRLHEFRLGDLARLIWGLARLELRYADCQQFLDAVLPVVLENRSAFLHPEYVSDIVWAASRLEWQGVDEMLGVLCKMADDGLEKFKGEEFAAFCLGLQKMRYYPGDDFLRRFLDTFAQKVPTFKPAMVTTCLNAVASFGFYHQRLIDAVRDYCLLMERPLETRHYFDICWSFAILSCMDADMFKWMAAQIGKLDPCSVRDLQRRQFYQCLLDVHILHPTIAQSVRLDPRFEEDCYKNWSENQALRRVAPKPVIEAFARLRNMGFICTRGELIMGRRFAINSVRHRGLDQRFALEADVTFRNAPNRLLGIQIWRRRVLRALGWGIMDLSQWRWSKMSSEERDVYLQKKILYLVSEKKRRFTRATAKPGR